MNKVGKRTSSLGVNKRPFILASIQRFSVNVLLFWGVLLLGISAWFNLSFSRPSITEINNGHSSAFHSHTVSDPLLAIGADEEQVVSMPDYRFTTAQPSFTGQLELSFYYRCAPECAMLTLSVEREPQYPALEFVISHRAFEKIDWFYIQDKGFTLYQKEMKYASIEDYLSNFSDNNIVADELFITSFQLENSQLIPLDSTTTFDNKQMVISTRAPQSVMGEWFKYSIKIKSLAGAQLDNNKMVWHLRHYATDEQIPEVYIARYQEKVS